MSKRYPVPATLQRWIELDREWNNGEIASLEDAPILFIQPVIFNHPVKKVARNIRDFIAVFIALKEIYVLERFTYYHSEVDKRCKT